MSVGGMPSVAPSLRKSRMTLGLRFSTASRSGVNPALLRRGGKRAFRTRGDGGGGGGGGHRGDEEGT